jgi:iron complex outermembrane recepter protein
MKRVVLFMLAFVSIAWNSNAQMDFSATVKNKEGIPLNGANVVLSGTYWQTTTDVNGVFMFKRIPAGKYKLKISYIGYLELFVDLDLSKQIPDKFVLNEKSIITQEITIKGLRADGKQPATYSVINKTEIDNRDLGQDIPYLLSMEPSVVSTSDGGTGIGYTYMRIRGLDAKKINVTINGIPYNDPESHNVYWVDIPDIASSMHSIQIQRGVGKSANGPGSFGASINVETNQIPIKPYFISENSFGSYNTLKNSIQAGTGLLNNHWFAEGRLSRIGSDGYIDRASSKLRSYFAQAGYYSNNSIFRVIAFGGFEETYQAWYGLDSAGINQLGRTYNYAGYYTDKNGVEHFYDKQVDHYNQNHLQLNYSHSFNDKIQFSTVLNYTTGKGYYQEYYDNANLNDYFINNVINGTDTIKVSDLAGRKWLDNKLLSGNTFISCDLGKLNLTYGIGFSRYFDAKHFGEIIWSEVANADIRGNSLYSNVGNKTDISNYLKLNYSITDKASLYLDLNYRHIHYKALGVDRESGGEVDLDINKDYNFLNPIIGVSYLIPKIGLLYTSFGISHREPTRSDFISNNSIPGGPKPEKMVNTEIGIRNATDRFFYQANVYLMNYRDELIKTGQLDDTGDPIVRNTGSSYRMGIELSAGTKLASFLTLKGNVALSSNKTDFNDFVETTSNKTGGDTSVIVSYKNVSISFSPNIVAGTQIICTPIKSFEVVLLSKFVGKQYLDNTQSEQRILKSYLINDLRFNYKFSFGFVKEMEFKLLVNNIFNLKYNSNGYMYGSSPYYYPQALRNYLVGLTIQF